MAQGYENYVDFLKEQIKRLDNLITIDPKNKEAYLSEKSRIRKEIEEKSFVAKTSEPVKEEKPEWCAADIVGGCQHKGCINTKDYNCVSDKRTVADIIKEPIITTSKTDEGNGADIDEIVDISEEQKLKIISLLDKKAKPKLIILCELCSLPAKEVKENSATKQMLMEYMSTRVKEEDIIMI